MNSDTYFEGKKYISIKKASELTGYSRDYIGQLCRLDKITSRRIDRSWFVLEESILSYRASPDEKLELEQIPNEIRTSRPTEILNVLKTKDFSVDKNSSSFVSSVIKAGTLLVIIGVMAVGLFSFKASDVKKLSQNISAIPAKAYSTSEEVLELYSSKLSPFYIQTGEFIFEESKLIALNSASYFSKGIDSTALSSVKSIDGLATSILSFTISSKNKSLAFIEDSLNVLKNVDSPEFTYEVANPFIAFAFSPFENSSQTVYKTINNFIDNSIYSPLIRLFDGEELVASPVYAIRDKKTETSKILSQAKSTTKPRIVFPTTSPTTPKIITTIKTVERMIEKFTPADVTKSYVDLSLQQLKNNLTAEFSRLSFGTGGAITNVYNQIAHSQKIDNIYNTAISNPRITSGSITGTSIVATLLSADSISTPTLTVTSATITNLVGTNGTITNLNLTNSTTTNATTTSAYITNFVATNATTTNLFSTTASSTNSFGTLAQFGTGTFGNLNTTGTNIFSGTGTSTFDGDILVSGLSSWRYLTAPSFTATSTTATSTFAGGFGIGTTSPSQKFSVTGSGYFTGGLGIGVATTAPGVLQTSGDVKIGGNLLVNGNSTTLGTSISDILVVNSTIGSSLVPNQNIIYDLGSPAFYWRNVYTGIITANSISAASSSIAGTNSGTFTINADNVSSDTEDSDLIFFRGIVTPNALLSWKSISNRFEFNQPTFIQNADATNDQVTLTLKGTTGTTADIFNISSSTGQSLLNFAYTGNLGIGTTSPGQKLSVAGDILGNNFIGSYFTATSTTATTTLAGFLDVLGTGTNATSTFSSNLWVKGGLRIGTNSLYFSDTAINTVNGGFSLNSIATSTFSTNGFTVGTSQFVVQQNSGMIGIGSLTPTSRLDITNSANSSAIITLRDTIGGVSMEIRAGTSTLDNTFVGREAGLSNTTGNLNTANGVYALKVNTTGNFNTANGAHALALNTTGYFNTANGMNALYSNTTGIQNTANGVNALFDLNILDGTGNNSAFGYNTGRGITTGINNTILGANVTGLSATLSNNIIIADGAGNRRINVDSTGSVGIGTTSPFARFSVNPIGGDSIGFVVGSSTATQLSVSSLGFGTTTLSGLNIAGQATSTSNIGFNITTGCFAISGTCLVSYTNDIVNSYIHASTTIPKLYTANIFTGLQTFGNASSTQLTTTGSTYLATTGGNVGIGTASPTQKLDVSGKAMFTPTSEAADTIRVNNASGLAGIQLGTYPGAASYGGFWGGNVTAGASNYTFIGNGTTETLFNVPTGGLIAFRINNSFTPNAVQLNSTGLGVNTNSGASRLSVAGNAGIGSSYATIAAPTNGLIVEGNVGIGTTNPTAVLHLKAGTATSNTAPFKFTSGVLNTTAEAGAVEFLTDAYYGTITTGASRKTFAFLESPTFTGTVTIPTPFTLGAVSVLPTGTELNFVDGVTSAIQTQIDSKQATGNYITALTGDGTASGPGSVALTLATVNANVGSFGSSTSIPTFTVNGKGLITAASGNVVIAPAGTLTGTTLAAGVTASSLTSVGTLSSLTVTGAVNSTNGPYQIAGVSRVSATGSYTTVNNGAGTIAIYLGSSDPGNYYDNTTHYFRGASGSGTGLTLTTTNAAFGGTVTGGTYNGQTISSAANFTNTVTVASEVVMGNGSQMRFNIDQAYCNNGSNCKFNFNGTGTTAIGNAAGVTMTGSLGLGIFPTKPLHLASATDGPFLVDQTSATENVTIMSFLRQGANRGSITCTYSGNTCTFNSISDVRVKSNIVDTHFGLDDLMKIKARDYTVITDPEEIIRTGFVAQELNEIYPQAVAIPNDPENMWAVDYGKVTPLLVVAIQDLSNRSAGLLSATTSPQMFIDVDGNVGIGTSTPAYKLHVLGDIAGTSFVNISTRDSKKDIEYITKESKSLILDTIGNIKIAKYHYNEEGSSQPLRLGLIAEESPIEILSVNGKGVDIYKLATFTLAGVQELNLNVESLVSSTPETGSLGERVMTNIFAKITSWFASATNGVGDFFANRVRTKELCISNEAGETCVTRSQLGTLLANASASQNNSTPPPTTATSTPPVDSSLPVITILGDSPATVTVGTTYSDMGATVSDTNADGSTNNNLGLQYSLNGISVQSISIDTSTTSTNTIIYGAIDAAGNTGTATRIVNVVE